MRWPAIVKQGGTYRNEHAFISGLAVVEDVKTKGSGSELFFFGAPFEGGDSDLEGDELLDGGLDLLVTFFEGVELDSLLVGARIKPYG